MTTSKSASTGVLVALVSSLASLGLHLYLALHYYELKLGFAQGKSICNINDHLNCDVVAMSKYAVLWHIPLATWGLATHMILSTLLILWWMNMVQNRSRLLRICLWLGSFVLLMTVVMGGISSLMLSTYCLFCVFTYVLSVPLWIGLWRAWRETEADESGWQFLRALLGPQKWMAAALLMIPGVAWLAHSMILDSYGAGHLESFVNNSISNWRANPAKGFDDKVGLVLERSGAPATMTIVEFADYLCPHCRAASGPLHNFFESHSGVRLILKIYPLDGSCNNDIKVHGDGLRCELASAALCAEKLEHRGWQANDYIFDHQTEWSVGSLQEQMKNMSQALQLAEPAFSDCRKSNETHQEILHVASEGTGISGTPTIYVNGQMLENGQLPPVMDAAAALLGL